MGNIAERRQHNTDTTSAVTPDFACKPVDCSKHLWCISFMRDWQQMPALFTMEGHQNCSSRSHVSQKYRSTFLFKSPELNSKEVTFIEIRAQVQVEETGCDRARPKDLAKTKEGQKEQDEESQGYQKGQGWSCRRKVNASWMNEKTFSIFLWFFTLL